MNDPLHTADVISELERYLDDDSHKHLLPAGVEMASRLFGPNYREPTFASIASFLVETIASAPYRLSLQNVLSIWNAIASGCERWRGSELCIETREMMDFFIKYTLVSRGSIAIDTITNRLCGPKSYRRLSTAALSPNFPVNSSRERFQILLINAMIFQSGLGSEYFVAPAGNTGPDSGMRYEAFTLIVTPGAASHDKNNIELEYKPLDNNKNLIRFHHETNLWSSPVFLFVLLAQMDDAMPVKIARLQNPLYTAGSNRKEVSFGNGKMAKQLVCRTWPPRDTGSKAKEVGWDQNHLGTIMTRLSRAAGFDVDISSLVLSRMAALWKRPELQSPSAVAPSLIDDATRLLSALPIQPDLLVPEDPSLALNYDQRRLVLENEAVRAASVQLLQARNRILSLGGFESASRSDMIHLESLYDGWTNAYHETASAQFYFYPKADEVDHDDSGLPETGRTFEYDILGLEAALLFDIADGENVSSQDVTQVDTGANPTADLPSFDPDLDMKVHLGFEASGVYNAWNEHEKALQECRSALDTCHGVLDLAEAVRICSKPINNEKQMLECHPGQAPLDGLCNSCNRTLVSIIKPSGKDTKSIRMLFRRAVVTHVTQCHSTAARQRAKNDIGTVYPSELSAIPYVQANTAAGKTEKKRLRGDGTVKVDVVSRNLASSQKKDGNEGEIRPITCAMCSEKFHSVSLVTTHFLDRHNIFIPFGKSSEVTVTPSFCYHDMLLHHDPQDISRLARVLYRDRIELALPIGDAIYGVRSAVQVSEDMLDDVIGTTEEETGYIIIGSDTKYRVEFGSHGETIKDGLCFLCACNPLLSLSDRMRVINSKSLWKSHGPTCLRYTLDAVILYWRMKLRREGMPVPKVGPYSCSEFHARMEDAYEGDSGSETVEVIGGGEKDSESDLSKLSDEEYQDGPQPKRKAPRRSRATRPVATPHLIREDGQLGCPDPHCLKVGVSFDSLVNASLHFVLSHHLDLVNSDKAKNPLVSDICFVDDEGLEHFLSFGTGAWAPASKHGEKTNARRRPK